MGSPRVPAVVVRAAARLGTVLREAAVVDLRALALYRVSLGALLLWDFLNRLPDAAAHYGDAGVWPRSALGAVAWPVRLYFVSGEAAWVRGCLLASAAAALALLLGWRTRAANAVCLWALMCLQIRNGHVLQGGDGLLLLLLFWGLFLPLGARASLDARRVPQPVGPATVYGPATVALYLQVATMYVATGALKLGTAHWRAGQGVAMALGTDDFVTRVGAWLRPYDGLLAGLTYYTLVLEIAGPFLLLVPARNTRLRTALALSFIAFHAGLATTLRLGLFSFVSMAAWTFTLPWGVWERLGRTWRFGAPTSGTAYAATPGTPAPASPRWLGRLAGAWAVYLLLAALVASHLGDRPFAQAFLRPAGALQLKVRWRMFVGAREETGHLVNAATLADGRRVDPVRGGAPLPFERLAEVSATFPNQRWRKYLSRLVPDEATDLRASYADYVCAEGRRGRFGSPVRQVTVHYMKRRLDAKADTPPERVVLIDHACP
jgi:hypothetical protein